MSVIPNKTWFSAKFFSQHFYSFHRKPSFSRLTVLPQIHFTRTAITIQIVLSNQTSPRKISIGEGCLGSSLDCMLFGAFSQRKQGNHNTILITKKIPKQLPVSPSDQSSCLGSERRQGKMVNLPVMIQSTTQKMVRPPQSNRWLVGSSKNKSSIRPSRVMWFSVANWYGVDIQTKTVLKNTNQWAATQNGWRVLIRLPPNL